MPELDSLYVTLEADIALFQQQLDRAKAQLSSFGAATRPAEQGITRIETASKGSTAGLGRLNGALLAVTRQATGMNPVVARTAEVLGTFAIGSSSMVPILLGVAAVAGGYALITKEARETKKAAEEAGKAITDAWMSAQTQGDITLINQQKDVGFRLDNVTAELQKLEKTPDRTAYGIAHLANLLEDQKTLQTQYTQATELLSDRRAKRQEEEAERVRRAWIGALRDVEEAIRLHHSTLSMYTETPFTKPTSADVFLKTGEMRQSLTGAETAELLYGFDLSPLAKTSGQAAEALERMKKASDEVTEKYFKDNAAFFGGSNGLTEEPRNFFGRTGDSLKQLFNPETIASGLITGFASTAINSALGLVGKLASSVLGLGDAAEKAAQQLQLSMNNIRAEIAHLRGDTGLENLVQLQEETIRRLEQLGVHTSSMGIEKTKSVEELLALITRLSNSAPFIPNQQGYDEALALTLEWLTESMKHLGDEVNRVTDGMRNVPTGFKINLAEFNATEVAAGPAFSTARGGVVVHVIAEPEGVFRVVEDQAVRRIRAGGQPAWEIGR
jgi:hypothetical protein